MLTGILLFTAILINQVASKDLYLDLTAMQIGATYPKLLDLEVGQRLTISLKENPTTGYRWMIVDQDLRARGLKNVVKVLKETYVASSSTKSPMIVGGGGIKTI
jgi:predicted secreted protein